MPESPPGQEFTGITKVSNYTNYTTIVAVNVTREGAGVIDHALFKCANSYRIREGLGCPRGRRASAFLEFQMGSTRGTHVSHVKWDRSHFVRICEIL